ncbi:MAG: bifunctional NADP-dependent methylenetetrahydromethanopterin dehydrogenase/methylenetetrahydrofolate dehydrogenase [Planctomycetia bacterium]|nr:bifunctional NADP-dependent methylenetetrahydromethanopterin dehydrogenase/methylenetetrahydrofolate dehydrogenase [Planctomycetia bacterium]
MKKILIQLDTDPQPSVFDRVVAVDADVDQLFSYAGVTPETVEPLVHGAIFTRGGKDLAQTAIFIGGSNVSAGEALLKKVVRTFFGPMRVSVIMDSNGSNTTAAAAVLSARKHLSLAGAQAVVLAGTGPVGLRAAQLLAAEGARVRVGSRSLERAVQTCDELRRTITPAGAELAPCATATRAELEAACRGAQVVIAAGAAGVELLPADLRKSLSSLKVAIDLNAVPPAGIAGIAVFDKAVEHDGVVCYGAVGVGGLKMKIHKAALRKLFESNDQVLDTPGIYKIGESLV